ncbi:uncharacterized protein LOC129293259 isoform X2 [Prosopis cineraria]|uniref:uncharacterized protein LOC129293259 isoform X2 n=2 Tax=Prosopis cineraria TaxID=364024 RepID=UPI00240F9002|nr:uncharacterized protein LOC129293259 isoform X2 [Prosopis cineraria]
MMNTNILPFLFLYRPSSLGRYVFRQISFHFRHLEIMSKSWDRTEPDSFACHGPQFSGDTGGGTSVQGPQKKQCQREYIMMVGTMPVPFPSNTCSESGFMSNSVHSAQTNMRSMQTNVDENMKPCFSPSSVSHSLNPAKGFPASNIIRYQDKSRFPNQNSVVGNVKRPHSAHRKSNNGLAVYKVDRPDIKPFDICRCRRHISANTESCTKMQEGVTEKMILRPGMVLLKHYLSHNNQVELVRICRELGLGPGGFYRPGYKDGAKLRLQMMCLGLDWDPQTRKYGNIRSMDHCEPPNIPSEFRDLAGLAVEEAQNLSKKMFKVNNVEDVLPSMSPDICIVNFYTAYGRLGLHQDRDESRESLHGGLPVVSFSVGDSAEFLYGDERDVKKAEKVVLDSGDVLIFGGESRLVYHGVSYIIPNSAPRKLLEATGLRPGRLNLTFRQY